MECLKKNSIFNLTGCRFGYLWERIDVAAHPIEIYFQNLFTAFYRFSIL